MMKRLMVLFLISVTFIITVVAQKEGLTATPTRIADSSEALFSTKGLSPSSAFLIYDLMFGKMSDKEIKEKYHFVEVNGTVEIPAVVWIEGEDVIPELANYGVRVKHKYGNLLTVQIPLNRFMELAQSNLCNNINVGEEVHPNLDKALAATGVNDIYNGIGLSHGLDGTGVVVGILDVGFEYGHPAFYDSTGTTLRIKRVWDQNAPAVTPPSEFNYYYGNELTTPNEILAAQHSTDGTWELHGTHVAGIAAGCGGNDTIGKTYRGVAPNADIVLVAYRENITCIFEGIDYIKSYAASINKPCVINMSFGSHIGPHDGTSDLCVLFDSTVASSPGVMLVQAAGNEGNKNIHISKTFSSTDSILRTLVAFDEPASGRGKIDVWGNPNESFEVGLFLYNSASHTIDTSSAFYSSTSGFYTFDFTEGNSEVSTTAHISCKDDNRNGRQNIYIELYNTNRLSNNQHIGIEIRCTSNNTVHAWTQGDNSTFINGGYSLATAGDVDYTISDQGTCHSVITVGSYFARNTSRFGQLSNFSSHGPTLDERTKPDITAPGESITAPFNRFAVQGQGGDNIIFQLLVTAVTSFQNHTEYYGTLSGTSMATPFVAGVLALCLQENPHLTYSQAIDLLHNKAITDEHTGNISSAGNDLWGWGKVNAMGILDQIRATAPPYTEDFEGETVLWRLANGSNTNRWVIGSATNHTSGGEKALYISDDNGITNTYTNTAASSVIAYCPLILEARDYAISFDWKSYGEGYYDFLRAALVPASVDINLDDWEPTTLPNSYIAIDGGSQLVIHVTWKTQVSTVTIPTAGEYNLVFFWHNNHIGGTNPGAAVDNIIIDTIASNINMPTVLTSSVSGITQSTASCGGNVTSDGGSTITERGVCWSTSQNPTIADAHTSDGAGTGTFTSSITGLTAGTTYYVRAYATNSSGTAYGVILTFTTDTSSSLADGQSCSGTPTITDHEGNVYATVQIGSQCWMRDNLRTTTSPTTGTYLIPAPGTGYTYTGKQARWYNNDSTTYAPQNYGLLYNWNAAADTFNTDFGETSVNTASNNAVSVTFNGPRRGVCPAGWHLPSDAEWTQLTDYVSSQGAYTCGGNSSYIAKALASGTGWNTNTNTCTVGNTPSSNNATGFSAVPAGDCYGSSFYNAGYYARFWSSSQYTDVPYGAYRRGLAYVNADVHRSSNGKTDGFSVRCLRDETGGGGSTATLPTVTTDAASGITATAATCGGNVTGDGNATVTARGVCWGTSPNPTVSGSHTADGSGTGAFTSTLTGLTPNTTYYVRAYATNSAGTAYGEEVTFTTLSAGGTAVIDAKSCPDAQTVSDHEGNVYATVQIGTQCWMRDNLRTTTSPTTGTYLIPAPGTGYTYTGKQARWYNNDSTTYAPQNYGLLYNWNAAADTFNTAYGETSVNGDVSNAVSVTFNGPRRGVCPAGWHLPSDAEWTQLTDYVSSQGAYTCGGNSSYIAKALASGTGWNTKTNTCAVGNTPSSNNATGFSAVPAGYCYGSSFYDAGNYAYFWSSSQITFNPYYTYYRFLHYYYADVFRGNYTKYYGYSVRCLRDENSAVDTSECFNDCHSGSCGEYGSAMYTAAQQLCHLGIVEGINGALQPDTNITRAQLAKVTLYSLYNGSSNVPSPLVSDFFPSIYPDLQVDTAYYYRPAKALLYLEYGDGVSPFDRDRSVFNPTGRIERCLVLKVLLETFNIAPATGGTTAFDDYGPSGYSSSKFWGYAQKAYDLGIVQTTHFRPNDYCTRGEAFLYLYRILTNSSINKPTPVNTEDPATSDFFIPTNLSPKVANAIHGVENGNFNYYEKDFFNIPGYMDLNFGVSYNSYLTEIPDDFYPVKPLGKAWTHTYDMYMNIVTDFYHNNSVLVFHMQNGSLLLYKNVNGTLTSMTEGNYYELTTSGNNQYILKSKDQISYTFERKSTSDGIYYLTQIKDRNNNAIDITYSSGESHYRISSVSTLGRTLNFYYTSGTDLLYYVNDPIDRNVYFYYTDEQLGSLKDAKNQTTYFTYGTSNAEKGLLTEITLPRGNMVFNGYQQRKLVSIRRVNNSNSYTHTAVSISPNYQNGSSSSTVTTNLNGSQSITTNYTMNGDNRITNVNDGLHNDMSYEYNISGKPDLVSKASDNKTNVQTTFSYNNQGLPTTVSVSAGGTTRTTNITYTSLNDVYQYTDAKGNTTTYNYTNGNLTSVVDALGNTTTIVNNSQGKPTQVTDPSGVVTNFTYNSYGNETRQSIPSISTYFDRTYDGVSRVTSAKTSCDCQTTSYTYDDNDNMVTETDALNHTTNYTYDANDNVTKITDAKGNATNLTYDDNDFLTSVSAQGASRSYTYNRDGSVATFTNPNGNTFNFSYNSSGELLNDGYASYDYNNKGQLISVTKDNKAITFSYDAFGRISSTAYNNKTISYTYDNNDNILTMTYPGNKTVTYTYDALNRMTSVKDWNNATTTYNYRDDGQLSYYQYPNGVRTTYGYDSGGRAVSQTTKRSNGSGTVVASYNYTWDEFGNHTQETFTEPYTEYPSIPNATTNYSYNNANRLTAAGNLTFGYDNNGNTTSRTGRTYGYDTKNNLTSVSGDFSASYSYDGLGNRRSATRNGVTRQYVLDLLGDMSNVLMETDGSGNTLYYYVYGANGLVSRIDANNNTRYYVYDYRGSTVAMTDATNAATVTHKYQYDDFGKVLQSEEADANPFRYVGQLGVMYEDNALTFMRARYYDPGIGRFLSEDPIWSTNLYPYADNNPIVYLDPDGNWSFNPDDMKDKEKKIKEDQKSVLRYIWKTTFPDVGKCEGWKKRFHMSKCVK